MEIRIKLMGMLKQKSPDDGRLKLDDGATVADVLRILRIPEDSVNVVTINGNLERNLSRSLSPDDQLTVLPPVGGG